MGPTTDPSEAVLASLAHSLIEQEVEPLRSSFASTEAFQECFDAMLLEIREASDLSRYEAAPLALERLLGGERPAQATLASQRSREPREPIKRSPCGCVGTGPLAWEHNLLRERGWRIMDPRCRDLMVSEPIAKARAYLERTQPHPTPAIHPNT